MTERIAQRFARNAVDVVADNRMEAARRALDRHPEQGRGLLAIAALELFGQRRNGLRQFVAHDRGRSQVLNRVTAFDDRLIRSVESSVECLEGLRRVRGQQVTRALKAKHQSLKTLEQRIVQFACDSRPLVDPLVEPQVEGMCDLPESELIQGPEEREDRYDNSRSEPRRLVVGWGD